MGEKTLKGVDKAARRSRVIRDCIELKDTLLDLLESDNPHNHHTGQSLWIRINRLTRQAKEFKK